MQVEHGDTATTFVEPQVYEYPLSGIFKNLQEIRLEMTDKDNSELWTNIRANTAGMIREYHDTTLSTTIAETAEGIHTEIADNSKELLNTMRQTADGLSARISNNTGDISQVNQTIQGIQSQIRTAEGNISRVTQTAEGLSSRISNNTGDISTIKQTMNAYERVIGKTEPEIRTNISQVVQNSGIIQQTVRSTDLTNNQTIQTIQRQMADSWGVRIKSATEAVTSINATAWGVRIKGDLIHLNGNTLIDRGVINDAHINSLSANKITTGTLNAGNVRIINLDVNNLTGNKFNFIQGAFQSSQSRVRLTGDGMDVVRNDGSYSTRFNTNGLEIWRDGQHVGSVHSLNAIDRYAPYVGMRSMSITTQPDAYLSISYYSMQNNVFYRALSLGGDGRLRLHIPFYYGATNSGFRLSEGRINSGGQTLTGSQWTDVESGGGMMVTRDKDTWLSLSNGNWISMTSIKDRLNALEAKLRSMTNYTAPTYTPPSQPSTSSNIKVGDRVRFHSGQTTYYDNNEYPVTIPTNKWGRNYRTETYIVSDVNNSRRSKYRLNIDGVIIAWAREGQIYKV